MMVMWMVTMVMMVMMVRVGGHEWRDLPPMDFTHRVMLDPHNNYLMMWTPRDNEIIIEVQVGTLGYVGLGFSPGGGMKGADIVLGWVDQHGQAFLHDRFATGYMVPTVDESQDVTLLGGFQNNTHTVLRFSRPWTPCDYTHDLQLGDDTVRVIWSYSSDDPTDVTTMPRHDHRGTKSLYLREPHFNPPEMTPDVHTWDITAGNVSLPDNLHTLYWCKLFKIPPLTRKAHIIGYVPIIEERNLEYAHHLLVYECHVPESSKYYERWVDMAGTQCHSQNMPQSWKFCHKTLIAWAIGGQGETMPPHVGFPLGEDHGGATYFMMEMHYDNPNLKSGIVDNSGIRVFYTEKLRKYDAGVLMTGHSVSPLHIVPPGQVWRTDGHCSGTCTNQHIPSEGVRAFQGLVHSHLLGTSLSLRHIRNGTELPPIVTDKTYDFNFQQMRVFREEITILPGDHLITECTYDSTARTKPTFGGLSTEEEMCLSFISYYPRVDLSACLTKPLPASVLNSVGVQEVYNHFKESKPKTDALQIDEEEESRLHQMYMTGNVSETKTLKLSAKLNLLMVKAPQKYLNKTFLEILESDKTWQDNSVPETLQKAVLAGPLQHVCITSASARGSIARREETITYPVFTPLTVQAKNCTPSAVELQQTSVVGAQEPYPSPK